MPSARREGRARRAGRGPGGGGGADPERGRPAGQAPRPPSTTSWPSGRHRAPAPQQRRRGCCRWLRAGRVAPLRRRPAGAGRRAPAQPRGPPRPAVPAGTPASRWATPSARPRRRSSGPGRPGGGDLAARGSAGGRPGRADGRDDRPAPALAGADGRRLARRLLEVTAERHLRVERAGWCSPDLKQDVGGLRDLHAVGWLAAVAGWPGRPGGLELVRAELLAVREALHGQTRRKNDRVRADLQPAVAKALGLDGDDGADRLMAAVHTPPGRSSTWPRSRPGPWPSGCSAARAAPAWSRLEPGEHPAGGRAAGRGRNRRGRAVRQPPMQGPFWEGSPGRSGGLAVVHRRAGAGGRPAG